MSGITKVYLYVFEDGDIRQSYTPPEVEDIDAVEDGTLQVIVVENGKAFDIDRKGFSGLRRLPGENAPDTE